MRKAIADISLRIRRLIQVFAFLYIGLLGYVDCSCVQGRLCLVWTDAQADLHVRYLHMIWGSFLLVSENHLPLTLEPWHG